GSGLDIGAIATEVGYADSATLRTLLRERAWDAACAGFAPICADRLRAIGGQKSADGSRTDAGDVTTARMGAADYTHYCSLRSDSGDARTSMAYSLDMSSSVLSPIQVFAS